MPRFLVRELPGDSVLDLPEREARHVVRSLRMKAGDELELFDGAGRECRATILRVEGSRVSVRTGRVAEAAGPGTAVIAAALPKGKRLPWMIQKLAELGVREFVPVAFRRSVVRWSPSKAEKLRKVAEEASKQCGRSDVMVLGDEVDAAELGGRGPVYVAEPGAEKTLVEAVRPGPALVVVGPEGGLLRGELGKLEFTPVSLGRTILRVETAAVAAAAVLAQR